MEWIIKSSHSISILKGRNINSIVVIITEVMAAQLDQEAVTHLTTEVIEHNEQVFDKIIISGWCVRRFII